jgi:hypothetical protein
MAVSQRPPTCQARATAAATAAESSPTTEAAVTLLLDEGRQLQLRCEGVAMLEATLKARDDWVSTAEAMLAHAVRWVTLRGR